jgi:eukaryotic-like serine/threonine-protein kinase
MSFRPFRFLGYPLPKLMSALADVEFANAEEQGRVDLHGPHAVDEPFTELPDTLRTATLADAVLPEDHPEVDVPGVILEKYLGGGGQGWVYAGRVLATGRVVAVKVLRMRPESSDEVTGREALLAARVRHRNVLRVFRAERSGPYWLVIMELIQGRELKSVQLREDAFVTCFGQLAAALRELGRQRIVHCDVKPSNVLLRSHDGSPVLVDFGLAWDLESERSQHGLFGTPYFLPPEAFELPGRPEPSWDAYALGVTAAVVLLGNRLPWKSLADLELAKLSGDFEAHLGEMMENLGSPSQRRWIARLVSREPAHRLEALADASMSVL